MIKYTSFKAIPQFTRAGSYAVDIPLDRVPKWVANEQEDPGLVLTPEFQRGHVWTKKQQVAYLEFCFEADVQAGICISTIPASTSRFQTELTMTMYAWMDSSG